MIIELTTTTSTVHLWKQERIIVHDIYNDGWRFWTDLEGSVNAPIAVYHGGELYCDLTDYIRTYPTVSALYFADDEDPTLVTTIAVQVDGLINPAGVIIPTHSLASYNALIVPPQMMYAETNYEAQAEFYATSGTWVVSGSATMSLDKRNIGQVDGAFVLSDGTHSKAYSPRKLRCGVRYAFLKWVSFSGATRIHLFEVVENKTEAETGYSLLPIQNEYIDIKGRVDGFTLRLDNLNAYDLWYYADLLTSSKVEVSFDGTNYDRVQVADKGITLPDGEAGTDGVFEAKVNWKRYDAVAM